MSYFEMVVGIPTFSTLPIVGVRPEEQASGARSDRKAQAPLPDATGMKQACGQTSAIDPSRREPERGRPRRCADGSDAASSQPSAAPNRIRRGSCDRPTGHREPEGTLRENPAAPIALARGHRHGPSEGGVETELQSRICPRLLARGMQWTPRCDVARIAHGHPMSEAFHLPSSSRARSGGAEHGGR